MLPPLYPLPGELTLSRRSFLVGSASFALAAMLSNRVRGAVSTTPALGGYPFTLGIASGDPAPDGMVLWTRLAPRPRETGGGMPAIPVEVSWQIAEDEAMSRVVQQGVATATPAWAHSVHVEVTGLKPERWYWYQFKCGGEVSPRGRTRTMPTAGKVADRLRFAFASCQKYEMGYYTAYEHMAREDLDLVVHLGDYIYEKGDGAGAVRPHGTKEILTLDDYRNRYALYKTDPALQAAHAMAPWIVTWDDHEVGNDYAGVTPEFPEQMDTATFLLRRAAGYQAYYEHMPLRRSALPSGPDMLLYRRLEFGSLTSFHVLDTRQYRTDQPKGGKLQPLGPALLDETAVIMGDRQRSWLFDGLEHSPASWNILAQQVMMARVDLSAGARELYAVDKWTGYEFERRRVLRQFRDRRIANPVVITGDIHQNWANELVTDFDPGKSQNVGVEFVGTSISSSGDGLDQPDNLASLLSENPCVKYHNSERGYVRCEVTQQAMRTDYRTVPYITRRDAPLLTRASFAVESGRPQLQRV